MRENQQLTGLGVVLVTASSQAEGEALARSLLEIKLAACITITPVHSFYTWQGEIHSESEWQLIIKTDLAQFPLISARIQELHSYDVPEIIALPIVAGSQSYLRWIAENVNPF